MSSNRLMMFSCLISLEGVTFGGGGTGGPFLNCMQVSTWPQHRRRHPKKPETGTRLATKTEGGGNHNHSHREGFCQLHLERGKEKGRTKRNEIKKQPHASREGLASLVTLQPWASFPLQRRSVTQLICIDRTCIHN